MSAVYNKQGKVRAYLKSLSLYHITGAGALVTIPVAILPSNNFLNPDLPFVPTTVRSIFSFSAYSTILPTTERTNYYVSFKLDNTSDGLFGIFFYGHSG